jgi:bacterioferritin-associated ferredoxin
VVICSCNVLTDKQISAAIAAGAIRPRDVYCACGCKAECGGCTASILAMVREGSAPAQAG